jgi:capsular polysaccharide biosynthesis protein
LNHLGYPDSYIIEIQQETVLLKKCLLPSKRRQYSGRKQTAWVRENNSFNWLRAKATDALDVPTSVSKSKKIFISREDAEYRRIQNRSEVVERLANLGFEKYVLSDLSFEQQVDLFSDAEIIVGAHGSGLINAIYSHDSLVVELFADRYTAAIYEICTNLGNDYVCIECEPEARDLRITTEQLDKLSKAIRRRDD